MNTTHSDTIHFQSLWREIAEPTLPATAEEISPQQFLIPKASTYYRSKAFVSQVSINPLIAASAPVFFLIERIQSLDSAPDIEKLHADLTHEMHAFAHQAAAHGYRPYMILVARYVLSAWIDQTIFNAPWGKHIDWEKRQFTDAPETEKNPFFLLLNRCLQEPTVYLDVLELFYLCMSLGCTGNDNSTEPHHTQLAQAREYLFETIRAERKEHSNLLEIHTPTETQETFTHFSLRSYIRSGIAVGMMLLFMTTYFVLHLQLEDAIHGIINSTL